MCYQKRKVRNPVKPEHMTGFDKTYIKAPCGHCPSCRKVKTNDWLVRSYFEFLGNENQAFFITLTFDNDHLPRYNGMPCFDSEVMKHFLYRLRYYIGKFRYMYATDYGGFIERPHYHMVIVPQNYIDSPAFFSGVKSSWQQGRFTNIQQLPSIQGNQLSAIRYICGYVNKDITWRLDDKNKDMPMRYRPRIQASKGFGLRALEEGYITVEQLLSDGKVSIPVGKNAKLVPYAIPRYYEMKLGYDYSYDPERRVSELKKNELGVQISKNRHNGRYVYFIKSFFSSRYTDVQTVLGDDGDLSYFGLNSWRDVVYSCLDNFEDFKEYAYYRDFINFLSSSTVKDSVRETLLNRPNWHYYEAAVQKFEMIQDHFNKIKCELETETLIEAAKERARKKLEHNPQLYAYLKSIYYDFQKIY